MAASCEPLPRSVAEEMLQVVARAICDRPGESPDQRDSRTRQMVHSTMGMQPRDGLEYMLSTMLVGHFQLILHSMHEVFHGQTESMSARTKSTIVALDRAMIGMIKEFRVERKRPLARRTEVRVEEMPVAASEEPATPQLDPAAFVAEMALALREAAEREKDEPETSEPEVGDAGRADGLERVVPVQTRHRIGDTGKVQMRPVAAVEGQSGSIAPNCPDDLPSGADEGTIDEHLAAFEKVLGAVAENLEAMRTLDGAKTAAATRIESGFLFRRVF
jgi:hypothetical protein